MRPTGTGYPRIIKSLKKKLPELRDAIYGYITVEQAGKLKVNKAHYENLESWKAELEELILAPAAPYQQELSILQTAPGIRSDFTAIGIISEISTNMEAFPSAKHLCSWAGLTPANNESAGKKKSVRVSKAGCYIRPLLVQYANAVVTSKKHPEIRNRYLRIKSVTVTRRQLSLREIKVIRSSQQLHNLNFSEVNYPLSKANGLPASSTS